MNRRTRDPDLAGAIAKSELADGEKLWCISAQMPSCLSDAVMTFSQSVLMLTHYHGPLADEVVADGSIRCPWHHALFRPSHRGSGRGAGLQPNCLLAVLSIAKTRCLCKTSARRRNRKPAQTTGHGACQSRDRGRGAAGFAAAEMLRREQFGRAAS